MIEQRIRARVGAYSVPAVVHAVQGDTGRVFVFELEDYTVTGAEGASLNCMRPDGSFYTYAGTVSAEDNTVTVALDVEGGALTQEGVVTFQLELVEAGLIVCTFRGSIIVEPVVGGEATQEEKDFRDAIQAQLNDKASNAQLAQVESDLTDSIDAVADDLAQEILDRESADATKANKTTTINGKSLEEDRVIGAEDVPYDNATSGMTATDVQSAIDELHTVVKASYSNTAVKTSPLTARRQGNVVYISSPQDSKAMSAGSTTFVTLDTQFRPSENTYVAPANIWNGFVTITTSGSVAIYRSSAVTASSNNCAFSATYIVD